jgi:hypothetical protein
MNIAGITPFNGVSDPAGDGKYEVSGTSSANMPQLDILNSNVAKVTTAPCSVIAPCYKVVMQLKDPSLAPSTAEDPDIDLVWSTMWFVPSTTDANGGKNFHVYAESNNGAALQCFAGENAVQSLGGGFVLTYPGRTQLPAANCQSTLGPSGNITVYVPLSEVTEAGPIDNRLHEVTASTMTLEAKANSNPPDPVFGIGGLFFDLIDVAQGYVFDLNVIRAVSRKTHDSAGTFDVDLPLTGPPGIECRQGQGTGANEHQIVVRFPTSISLSSVSVTSGAASLAGASVNINEVTVNLTGVTNAQRVEITLSNVNNGTTTTNVVVPVIFLLGDTTASSSVNSSDVSETQAESGHVLTDANFRTDVTANGATNSSDVSTVQAQSGTAYP